MGVGCCRDARGHALTDRASDAGPKSNTFTLSRGISDYPGKYEWRRSAWRRSSRSSTSTGRRKSSPTSTASRSRSVKLKGDFVWHHHEAIEDELVPRRPRRASHGFPRPFRDHPRRRVHRRSARRRAQAELCGRSELVLFEPASTLNTGNVKNDAHGAAAAAHLVPGVSAVARPTIERRRRIHREAA